MLFTTSWDDGYALDMKVAELLSKYGCTGTFYVSPKDQHMQNLMTQDQMRSITERHEIGAHSMNHPWLTRVSIEDAQKEITESKRWVEEMAAKPCVMFCYPYGDFNPAIASMVRDAGYIGARTTRGLQFASSDPFALDVSLQLYPFPWRPFCSRWWHPLDPMGPLRAKCKQLRHIGIPLSAMTSWLKLATTLFDWALATNQPFFHLWGHSHEIEKHEMWDDLDRFLDHVQKSGVESVTNAGLLKAPRV